MGQDMSAIMINPQAKKNENKNKKGHCTLKNKLTHKIINI